jgi:DNA-binding SARP family transcriptional activator
MAALTLNLLGGFEVRLGDHSLVLPTKRGQALLAFLAMTPGRRHSRDRLAGFLWEDRGSPDSSGKTAASNMRAPVYGRL